MPSIGRDRLARGGNSASRSSSSSVRDLVVEPRLVVRGAASAPAASGTPAARARTRADPLAPAARQPMLTARRSFVSSGLRNGEQTRLPDARIARRCPSGSRPRPGRRGGRRPTARRSCAGGVAALARRRPPRSSSHMRVERVAERRPVLEVERPGAASRPASRPRGPRRRRRPPRSTPRGSAAPGARNSGSDVPISRWSKSPVACSVIQSPLAGVDHARLAGRRARGRRASRSSPRARGRCRGRSSSARPRPRGRRCVGERRAAARSPSPASRTRW